VLLIPLRFDQVLGIVPSEIPLGILNELQIFLHSLWFVAVRKLIFIRFKSNGKTLQILPHHHSERAPVRVLNLRPNGPQKLFELLVVVRPQHHIELRQRLNQVLLRVLLIPLPLSMVLETLPRFYKELCEFRGTHRFKVSGKVRPGIVAFTHSLQTHIRSLHEYAPLGVRMRRPNALKELHVVQTVVILADHRVIEATEIPHDLLFSQFPQKRPPQFLVLNETEHIDTAQLVSI